MAVALFSRGVQPSEVMSLSYSQLKIWFEVLNELVAMEKKHQQE